MDCSIFVAKTKALISCADYRTADLLLCFRICKNRFSHDTAQIIVQFDQSTMTHLINNFQNEQTALTI